MLGLDISASSVKLVELRKTGSSYRVTRFAVEGMPENAVSDKLIVDIEAAGDAVRRVWKRSGSHLKRAAIAIGGAAVITKTLTIPSALSARECEEQVGLAASNLIPFPMEEVAWDFELLGPLKDEPETQEALLVATRRENVEHRQAVLEFAGLKAEIVDCESFAIENAFTLVSGADESPRALLDIGATTTTCSVFANGRLVYTREQPFGGSQLTAEIMSSYGLSYEEAGRAKRNGGLPDDYEEKVLAPFLDNMAEEAGRALQFYRAAASDGGMVEHVTLCGGCAALPGAVEAVAGRLDLPVELIDPLGVLNPTARSRAGGIERDAPSILVACGLALRSFQ
ncbi:MAG: pilus assembly protein PilM [Gammaproteobacteria bacterium]|nr:pilus assembly protein PilM [Gammaproteobacteria bacterium]